MDEERMEQPTAVSAETPEGEPLEMTAEGTVPVEEESTKKLEMLRQELAQLQTALAEAEQRAAAHLDGWQRAQASLANYRKRVEADREELEAMATANLVARLLPALDDFERAFANLPEELRQSSWLEGMQLIEMKVRRVLETEGVQPIAVTPGETFDPFYHQAILYQEAEGFEEGQIVLEAQRGYLLHERVLRPAVVVVAKAPAAPEPAEMDIIEGEILENESVTTHESPSEATPEEQA